MLNIGQASARTEDIEALSVPTEDGAIRAQGLSQAFEGAPIQNYDEDCDCITDANTGQVWTADDEDGSVRRRERRCVGAGLAGQRRASRTSPRS